MVLDNFLVSGIRLAWPAQPLVLVTALAARASMRMGDVAVSWQGKNNDKNNNK